MGQGDVIDMAVTYFPSFLRSRDQAQRLDAWMNGRQYEASEDWAEDDREFGMPFSPSKQGNTAEYENLRGLSPNNFAGLVVTSLSQTAYIEGIRRPGQADVLPVWNTFLRNRWEARQTACHRGAIGHGVAYGVVLPGQDPLTGSAMAKMSGKSAISMAAFYDNDDDEWPTIAIEAYKQYEGNALGRVFKGWAVQIYDAYVVHRLSCEGDGTTKEQWTYIDYVEHGLPVPPVARCVNRMDLDGNTSGEIEPVLPLLRRIDQDLFDRLINQRFGAWQVRYIAGMAKPTSTSEQAAQALKLRVEDLLVSTDPKTKFGTLSAGPLDPHIAVTDADLRILSAVTQTPPHHLLGLSSNLQAEALAAAEAGLQRKSFDFRQNAAEFHEQMARLVAMVEGDLVTAAAFDLQVRWRDTESRSFAQTVQALGILASQLKVPVELLWEAIPNWTDTDVERAKELVTNGTIEQLLSELIPEEPTTEEPTGGNAE